ncbi:transcription factor bHLH155-like isoform X2 [Impatiens glandulifera]|uniref:transcription factor bHLH155-like isoform X2 n=1 Tax=Impatiens glandulifera TaxID=253017 RepID=UPI001FB05B37|nr:transcription factor bHLH155-like isoform X2 [Impatiens glandulifera]
MEFVLLKKLLQSFCCSFQWNYAVFWKLQDQGERLLTWEDGCFRSSIREPMDMIPDQLSNNRSPMLSMSYESSINSEQSDEFAVDLAVAEMKSIHYRLGEGAVGEVALSGNYCWFSQDNITTYDFLSMCPNEWLSQLEAGIKTILLIPIAHHGVLQLGSLKKVLEDAEMVATTRDQVYECFSCATHFLHLYNDTEFPSMSVSPSNLIPMEDFIDPSNSLMRIMTAEDDEHYISGNQFLGDFFNDYSLENSIGVPELQYPSLHMWQDIITGSLDDFLCYEEEDAQIFSSYHTHDINSFENYIHENKESYSSSLVMKPTFINKEADVENDEDKRPFKFPRHSELHKALGQGLPMQTKGHLNESFFSIENQCGEVGEPHGWPFGSNLAVHLVEPVVVNGDDNMVYSFSDMKSCVTSNMDSTIDTFSLKEQKKKVNHHHIKKGSKLPNKSKRKTEPCENPRARPRDRQLIQERVKKLRDLVPDSGKCSIDGLLERTIKHMKHLESVTSHADKLKQSVEHKLSGEKISKSSGLGGVEHLKGGSWGFELGKNNLQKSPIVVEDLGTHGHMLIEMICNDYELFMEIAEIIRKLELTILKGEMESKWAYFIVEVSDGFQRLDIFWPLMQLMQRSFPNSII